MMNDEISLIAILKCVPKQINIMLNNALYTVEKQPVTGKRTPPTRVLALVVAIACAIYIFMVPVLAPAGNHTTALTQQDLLITND
jgi:hypothetical protein